MPRKIKDLAVKTGSYTDRSGQEKGRWKNIGSILQMDDGSKLILLDAHFNPAGVPRREGSDQIIISAFDPKERDGGGGGAPAYAPTDVSLGPAGEVRQTPAGKPPFDDDIPF